MAINPNDLTRSRFNPVQSPEPSPAPAPQQNNGPDRLDRALAARRAQRGGATAPDQNTSYLGDLATSLGTGALRLPSAATGLLDIPAGFAGFDRPFSRGADALGDFTGLDFDTFADNRTSQLTPDTQSALDAVRKAEGFGGTLEAFAKNPRAIGTTISEAIPGTIAGGAVGKGLQAAKLIKGAIPAAAVGEGAVAGGFQQSQIDESVDPRRAAAAATAAGLGVGVLGAVGGKIAKGLGINDVDTILTGGKVKLAEGSTRLGLARRVLGGGISEGVFEELPQGVVETITQNWAEGRPEFEGLGKAAAENLVAGFGMGAALNVLPAGRAPTTGTETDDGGAPDTVRTEGKGPDDGGTPLLDNLTDKELVANYVAMGYAAERGGLDEEGQAVLEEARKQAAAAIRERGIPKQVLENEEALKSYSELRDNLTERKKKLPAARLQSEREYERASQKIASIEAELAKYEGIRPNISDQYAERSFRNALETQRKLIKAEAKQRKERKGNKAAETRAKIADNRQKIEELAATSPNASAILQEQIQKQPITVGTRIADDGFAEDDNLPFAEELAEERQPEPSEIVPQQETIEELDDDVSIQRAFEIAEQQIDSIGETPDPDSELQPKEPVVATPKPRPTSKPRKKASAKEAIAEAPEPVKTFMESTPVEDVPKNKAVTTYVAALYDTVETKPISEVVEIADSLSEEASKPKASNKVKIQAQFVDQYLDTERAEEFEAFNEQVAARSGEPIALDEMESVFRYISEVGGITDTVKKLTKQEEMVIKLWSYYANVENVADPMAQTTLAISAPTPQVLELGKKLGLDINQFGERTPTGKVKDKKNLRKARVSAANKVIAAVKAQRGLLTDKQAMMVLGDFFSRWADLGQRAGKFDIRIAQAMLDENKGLEEVRLLEEERRVRKSLKDDVTARGTNDADSSLIDRSMQNNPDIPLVDNPNDAVSLSAKKARFITGEQLGLANDAVRRNEGKALTALAENREKAQAEMDRLIADTERRQEDIANNEATLEAARKDANYPIAKGVYETIVDLAGLEDAAPWEEIDQNGTALTNFLRLMAENRARYDASASRTAEGNEGLTTGEAKKQADKEFAEAMANTVTAVTSQVTNPEQKIADNALKLEAWQEKMDAWQKRFERLVAKIQQRAAENRNEYDRIFGSVTEQARTIPGANTLGAVMTDAQREELYDRTGIRANPGQTFKQAAEQEAARGSQPISLAEAMRQPKVGPKLKAQYAEGVWGKWFKHESLEGRNARGEHSTTAKNGDIYTYRHTLDVNGEIDKGWELWRVESTAGFINEATDVPVLSSQFPTEEIPKVNTNTMKAYVAAIPTRSVATGVGVTKAAPKKQNGKTPLKSDEVVEAKVEANSTPKNGQQSLQDGWAAIKEATRLAEEQAKAEADRAAEEDASKPVVNRNKAKSDTSDELPSRGVIESAEQLKVKEPQAKSFFPLGQRAVAGSTTAYGADASVANIFLDPVGAADEVTDAAATVIKMTPEQWAVRVESVTGQPAEEVLAELQRKPSKKTQKAVEKLAEKGEVATPVINTKDGTVSGLERAYALFRTGLEAIYVTEVSSVADTTARRAQLSKDKITYSEPDPNPFGLSPQASLYRQPVENPSTVESLQSDLQGYMIKGANRVTIVQSLPDLYKLFNQYDIRVSPRSGGFVYNGRAYLIADNIERGQGASVFMHEVGVHIGMSDGTVNAMAQMVYDMAEKGDPIAVAALSSARGGMVTAAGHGANVSQTDHNHEIVAYMVQFLVEDGVTPKNLGKASSPAGQFIRTILTYMRSALRALGIRTFNLTGQNMVDMAFGAANTVARKPNTAAELRMSADTYRSAMQRAGDVWSGKADDKMTDAFQNIKEAFRKHGSRAMFSSDLADAIQDLIPQAREYFQIVARRQTMRGDMDAMMAAVIAPIDKMSQGERSDINEYMYESQQREAWGFDPHAGATQPDKRDEHLEKLFNAMNPQQQAAVREVFRFADQMQGEMRDALRDEMLRAHEYLINRPNITTEERIKLENQLDKDLNKYDEEMGAKRVAWLPLRRWGEFAVVYISDDLKQAMDDGADSSTISDMKEQPVHYTVEFVDSVAKARERQRAMQEAAAKPGEVRAFARESQMAQSELIPGNLQNAFRAAVERTTVVDPATGALDNVTAEAQMRSFNKMYIQYLSETSIRKSELQRMNVNGADRDMLKGFVQYGSAVGGTVAGIRMGQETHQALNNIRDAVRNIKDPQQQMAASVLRNEILERHALDLDPQPTPVQDKMMGTASFFMLLSSPAYYAQNLTQPWLLTLPTLGGRHGLGASSSAMRKAYSVMTEAVKSAHTRGQGDSLLDLLTGDVADIEAIKDRVGEDGYALLNDMKASGLFDIGVAADFGKFETEKHGANGILNRTHRKFAHAVRGVEAINRGVTALAALELAKKTPASKLPKHTVVNDKGEAVKQAMTPSEYAHHIVMITQGDYSGHNAPSWIRRMPLGKTITQFRKFQLIQIGLLTRMVKNSLQNADPYEQAAARRQLGYVVGGHFLAGGMLGLPMSNIAAVVVQAFGDEDDPDDFETMVRREIGNEGLADLFLKGLPAFVGVDVSSRIGMGNTMSLFPYADLELSRTGLNNGLAALAGPFFGQASRWVDAAGLLADGEIVSGTIEAMPTGARNIGRAVLYSQRGVQRRNAMRDVAISPEDMSIGDLISVGVGLPSTTFSARQNKAAAYNDSKEFFNERSASIKANYIDARSAKDYAGVREARKEFIELQKMRVARGFPAQDLSVLTTSVLDKKKRERELRRSGGAAIDKTGTRFVERRSGE